MTELVPFQEKRKKQFKEDIAPKKAVLEELSKHFKKHYPTLAFGTATIEREASATMLGASLNEMPTLEFFSDTLASITSPTLLEDPEATWNLKQLELPVLLLAYCSKGFVKKPFLFLPKTYQKSIKMLYTDEQTLFRLARFLQSKKRAKKYMRIFLKRLGIYSTRKPPFKKRNESK